MMTTTSNIQTCACGTMVARLEARSGRYYSVRVQNTNTVNYEGTPTRFAVCDTRDFHNCPVPRSTSPFANFIATATFFANVTAKGAKRLSVTVTSGDATIEVSFNARRNVLYVTDGRPYGNNRYFGAIDLVSGDMRTGRDMMNDAERALLAAFDLDPVATAVASAKITGACAFCSLTLDDARSVGVGYGPRCAKKYGLPWGTKALAA